MTKKQGKSGTIDVKAILAEDDEFMRALVRTALQEVLEAEMTMRLLPRQSQLRSATDPGLPRTPRSKTHRPLHPGRGEPFRRPVAMIPADLGAS
jgi:hypothetical protein